MRTKKDQIDIKEALTVLQSQLFDISSRNPFVNVNKDKLWLISASDSEKLLPKKILEKQNFYLKEYGLETTLRIDLFIKWKHPSKDRYYTSPLLFQPIKIKKLQKIELQYKVDIADENIWEINPVIIHLFRKFFNFEFSANYESIEAAVIELITYFNGDKEKINVIDFFNDIPEWQLIKCPAIGTFNYQKSVLAQDFDKIIALPNKAVSQILGYTENVKNAAEPGFTDWFPLDISQKKVVDVASTNSLVIQGPPGTGKSHTIVSLLQHYLALGKKVLFVSEKKSALDVVYKRLGSLQYFTAYFDAEKKTKLSYYKSLKKAFDKVQVRPEELSLVLDKQSLLKSQIYPSMSRLKESTSTYSISCLENELLENEALLKPVNSKSQIPRFAIWKSSISELKSIETNAQNEWQIKTLGESLCLNLNKSIFEEINPFIKVEKKIDELLTNIVFIQQIQLEYQLNLDWDEFSKICLSASVLNMVNRNQIDLLFENTKSYKSFNTWSKKYDLTKNQLDAISVKNTAWKKRPSVENIESHLITLSSIGILASFKIKKSHNRIFQNYNQTIPVKKGKEILERLLEEIELYSKLNEIKIKLKHNLNILNPDTDIDFIFSIRQKTVALSHNYYQTILEHPEHEDLIGLLADQHRIIGNVNRIKLFLFTNRIPKNLEKCKSYLMALKSQLMHASQSVNELKFILNLESSVLTFILQNKLSISELSKIVAQNELDNRLKYHDYLKHLTGNQLLKDLTSFNRFQSRTFKTILTTINNKQYEGFQEIEKLCLTPHSKLSAEDKASKIYFKKAKRIAIHEMNKTRQLMPVKDLFQSAERLLKTIQPIWMLNPLAIAERLPLESEIFDVVIFDESSQIPMEDAIPAIYRSKQVVVVGDSQQMPPSLFFTGSSESSTLLNEAEKVLPSESLKWHYRSEHPDLISFSNQNFYENELKLFPSASIETPLQYHYLTNGVFKDSVNKIEAQAIACRLKELLDSGEKEIAIIALSKAQEKCIRSAITNIHIELFETILIRNLDSVQGIEKEIILISIGYAKNEDGKLNLNFGPINHEQGANRLNVLFSRAIRKMEIYTSIKASDLALSENNSINILSQFLQFANNKAAKNHPNFNQILEGKIGKFLNSEGLKYNYESDSEGLIISCFTNDSKQKLLLVNPGLYSKNEMNLTAVLSVFAQRFDEIKIILNQDWLRDAKKVKQELRTFFE